MADRRTGVLSKILPAIQVPELEQLTPPLVPVFVGFSDSGLFFFFFSGILEQFWTSKIRRKMQSRLNWRCFRHISVKYHKLHFESVVRFVAPFKEPPVTAVMLTLPLAVCEVCVSGLGRRSFELAFTESVAVTVPPPQKVQSVRKAPGLPPF